MKVTCSNCKIEINKQPAQMKRSKTGNHFCSRSCAAKFNNKAFPKRKPEGTCSICKKPCSSALQKCPVCIENAINKKQNMTLKQLFNRKSLKGKHRSWRNSVVGNFNRSWNKDKLSLPCAHCGYDKHVKLCHIKAVSSFPKTATLGEVNHPSNVIQLCPNCHWEFNHPKAAALSN